LALLMSARFGRAGAALAGSFTVPTDRSAYGWSLIARRTGLKSGICRFVSTAGVVWVFSR